MCLVCAHTHIILRHSPRSQKVPQLRNKLYLKNSWSYAMFFMWKNSHFWPKVRPRSTLFALPSLSQISEFLSDFAHFEIWSRSNFGFSRKTKKNWFWAFWALNNLQIAKMPQKFPWAIMASEGNLRSKIAKISIFSHFSKVSKFGSIILQNGQIPTETR